MCDDSQKDHNAIAMFFIHSPALSASLEYET